MSGPIKVTTEVYVRVELDAWLAEGRRDRALSDQDWEAAEKATAEIMREGEQVVRDIERHCDVDSARVLTTTELRCPLCASEWEEDEDGAPVCCTEAVEEWESQHHEMAHSDSPELSH